MLPPVATKRKEEDADEQAEGGDEAMSQHSQNSQETSVSKRLKKQNDSFDQQLLNDVTYGARLVLLPDLSNDSAYMEGLQLACNRYQIPLQDFVAAASRQENMLSNIKAKSSDK